MTSEFYSMLSQALGDEWRQVASYLGLSKARIQVGSPNDKNVHYEIMWRKRLCWVKLPVTVDSPHEKPVMLSFDVSLFFNMNKLFLQTVELLIIWNATTTVGEIRSTLCTKTPLYVRSGSYIEQTPLEHLSYIKQMPLEHLSYIKETSWNTSGRT